MKQPRKVTNIRDDSSLPLAEQWARTWGETLTKADTARLLGCSRDTVYAHLRQNHFALTINGRVLTRSIAHYMQTGEPQGTASPLSLQEDEAQSE